MHCVLTDSKLARPLWSCCIALAEYLYKLCCAHQKIRVVLAFLLLKLFFSSSCSVCLLQSQAQSSGCSGEPDLLPMSVFVSMVGLSWHAITCHPMAFEPIATSV